MAPRRKTTTSNFGVSTRESHDSTPFYDRFRAPELSDDRTIPAPKPLAEPFQCGDSRFMDAVEDGSVALVVTSPPYFAGKQYEEELEREGVPSSYLEYLEMLTDVFAECVRKLEPGGRIAVNVANLGRKPYRSLSADVIRILEHDLGLLLRGEIIWQKGEGASGSCAWGSFRSAANPVLRDISERVIIASKGRFDRALSVKAREKAGLPHESTLTADDFMSMTLDVWSLPTESARRVNHPAPFPVDLPEQLIRLYTFRNDLVLDPFMGSGSTLVAASRLDRRFVGYDLDPAYVEISRGRVEAEGTPIDFDAPAEQTVPSAGHAAARSAEELIESVGFTITGRGVKLRRTGVTVSFAATDRSGAEWLLDVVGANTSLRGGLTKTDAVWRTLGRAAAIREARGEANYVVLTSALPRSSSEGDTALRAAGPGVIGDIIDYTDVADVARLAQYAAGDSAIAAGFWSEADLAEG